MMRRWKRLGWVNILDVRFRRDKAIANYGILLTGSPSALAACTITPRIREVRTAKVHSQSEVESEFSLPKSYHLTRKQVRCTISIRHLVIGFQIRRLDDTGHATF